MTRTPPIRETFVLGIDESAIIRGAIAEGVACSKSDAVRKAIITFGEHHNIDPREYRR